MSKINISNKRNTASSFNIHVTGTRGPEGLSAYQIAVKNGYEGSEEEWLNDIIVHYKLYNNNYEFPNIGELGFLYIDKQFNKVYRWDIENRKYYCVGSDFTQINVISGGNADVRTNIE